MTPVSGDVAEQVLTAFRLRGARPLGLRRFRRGTICAIPLNARPIGYGDAGAAHTRLFWMTEKRTSCVLGGRHLD